MTDKEKIRAEIERIQETHERNLDKPMERGRIGYAHGCVDCCDRLLAFIDSLPEEPSCPKESDDLEEAAETFNRKDAARMWDGEIVEAAFKSGAEWQKLKMMEGSVEGEITKDIHNLLHVKSDVLPMPTKHKFGDKVKIIILKDDENLSRRKNRTRLRRIEAAHRSRENGPL